MKKLSKNIYYHTTRDGFNIGCIVSDDGVIGIDLPMSAEETRAWGAQLAELANAPLRAVIYTSADRVSFEAIESMNTPVVIHESARSQLYTPIEVASLNPFDASVTMIAPAQNKLPEMSFLESTTLVLGMDRHTHYVDVTHEGGHSHGSVFVTLRDSGVVFAGEHVAASQPALIAAGNFDRWNDILNGIKKNKKITTIVPGRGGHGAPAIVGETLDYIKLATTKIKAHIKAKRARNEVTLLIPDILKHFDLNDKSAAKLNLNLDVVRLNIRAGLERLFDDLRTEG
jgi:glyoxylase-like metal-dependent hydrolase (beta-lactamase superfamily II)